MSTATARELQPTASAPHLLERADWLWIGGISLAFVLFFWHLIERSFLIITEATSWTEGLAHLAKGQFNSDWSHGLILPAISVFYVVQNRHRLARCQPRICWLGLLMLFQGMISFALWISPGRNDMLQGYSAVFSLFGLVLFLLGPDVMQILWFPIVYLALAVKISDRYWEQIAWTLQWVASQSASRLLMVLGLDTSVDGATITLFRGVNFLGKLNVAEACSGLRMLMAFIALGTAVAFFSDRPAWQRWIMVGLTLPIAVAVNVGRVTIMGLLMLVNPQMAQGGFHTFVGMLMLIPALGLFLLLGWVLDHLFIPDESTSEAPAATATPIRTSDKASLDLGAPGPFAGARIALLGSAVVVLNLLLLLGFFLAQKLAHGLFAFAGRYQNAAFAGLWLGAIVLSWVLAWRVDRLVRGVSRTSDSVGDALQKSGSQPAGHPAPNRPSRAASSLEWPALSRNVATGVILTLLVGGAYALMLGNIRPDFFKVNPDNSVAAAGLAALLVVDLALLVAASWATLRRLYALGRGGLPALVAGRGIAFGTLLAAVVVLMGMLEVNGVVMIKERLPLRRSLATVAQTAGNWTMVREDPPLSPEVEDALGTKDYISRVYADNTIRPDEAGAQVHLHVAYYTGKADTVPHVPWRCWVAGGIEPRDIGDMPIFLEGNLIHQEHGNWYVMQPGSGQPLRLSDNPLTATIFTYAPPPPMKGGNVVYFFIANGKFLKSPEMVRQNGFDPSDRYSYYAKVEVMIDQVPDQRQATTRAAAFLSAILPDVLACLPDWDRVTQGPQLIGPGSPGPRGR